MHIIMILLSKTIHNASLIEMMNLSNAKLALFAKIPLPVR